MDRNINNIINHINSIKKGTSNKKGVSILIGAGADISSGGILFRNLKSRFLEENGCKVPSNINDKILDEKFENLIEQISQDSRCETLDAIMKRNKEPSEGYSLLVMLAYMGYVDAVITTNFDYLLEETQIMLNLTPFTVFTPGKAIPEEYYMRRTKNSPIYLKMHGDLSGRLVTHLTQNEIRNKEYGENFVNLFRTTIINNGIIIVGYGGYDSLITELFEKEIDNIDEVYWCNICNPKEDSELVKLLEQKGKLHYVNTTFDNLFQELAKSLLKDIKLKNTNPIFLPTVIQSKIDNQMSIFEKKFNYKNRLVKRKKEQEILDNFLTTFNNKCLAIIGEYKYGKSCFVYNTLKDLQDITFIPVVCDHKCSILESMSQAIGYYTDVPFPIMYSFLKWWDTKNGQLIFVIDDFFNSDYYEESDNSQIIDFFNFLYIAREFKCIQFIICFQRDIYNKLEKDEMFASFGNFISEKIYIEEFSEEEVEKLLKQNGAGKETIDALKQRELLYIPYVWEILNKSNILLTKESDFFSQYIDAIYDISTKNFNFTKYALKTILQKMAYNQVFDYNLVIDNTTQECQFLQQKGIIDDCNKIVYSELVRYLCKQYILHLDSWENVVSEIISEVQSKTDFTNSQIDVYVVILGDTCNIERFNISFEALNNLIVNNNITLFLKKIVIKVLQECIKTNKEIFICYLQSIDINMYSLTFQYYLFKVCAELCPEALITWNKAGKDSKLLYAAFVLDSDNLYRLIKASLKNNQLKVDILKHFKDKDKLIKLCHLLTYWGWDNTSKNEYMKLKGFIVNEVFPLIKADNINVRYTADILKKYAYNIFFNAGEDFEEQFVQCRITPIFSFAKTVLNNESLTQNEYLELLKLNTDINNSWIFIISNIIVIKSMKNQPFETYNMLYHFWDNIKFDVQAQHLDFFLSSAFWSLYVNEPEDRKKFVKLFENVVERYERILFMFPTTTRRSSIHKFSEEFEITFEDGFNPTAFYFYTAPYSKLVERIEWNHGNNELKEYWDLAKRMSDLGKYDDILRIVHALGQMISIYPEEGYSALENLTGFEHPIIKKGLIRIFKENYLRYSQITKKEMKKDIYHFNSSDIDEIIFNSDFLLENRTMEQLHWGRLFYNLEQLMHIDISALFLTNIMQAQSCLGFLCDIINVFIK